MVAASTAASSAVVLAPGTLAGLRLVFASLGIERIALSAGEYFDTQSFPDTAVDALDADDVLESVVRRRPNAVLLSQVTWKGERLPLEPIFRHIRRRLGGGARTPLLVADYAHAGAAGFPKVAESGADIVVGDVTKWITPPTWPDKLGYLWFRSPGHRAQARRIFGSFYLACAKPAAQLEARWVDPAAVEIVLRSGRVRRSRGGSWSSGIRTIWPWRSGCRRPGQPGDGRPQGRQGPQGGAGHEQHRGQPRGKGGRVAAEDVLRQELPEEEQHRAQDGDGQPLVAPAEGGEDDGRAEDGVGHRAGLNARLGGGEEPVGPAEQS